MRKLCCNGFEPRSGFSVSTSRAPEPLGLTDSQQLGQKDFVVAVAAAVAVALLIVSLLERRRVNQNQMRSACETVS